MIAAETAGVSFDEMYDKSYREIAQFVDLATWKNKWSEGKSGQSKDSQIALLRDIAARR